MMTSLFNIFFFFFQAEDGIRDKLVTGVQTCALPISVQKRPSDEDPKLLRTAFEVAEKALGALVRRAQHIGMSKESSFLSRSEERRVGKECRSRWSRYHGRKREHSARCV